MTCKLINIKLNVSNILATSLVLQPIIDVIAITCMIRPSVARQGVAAALMVMRKLSDFEVELWHDEPCLWDVSQRSYSNQDARKAAIRRISDKMEIVDICK